MVLRNILWIHCESIIVLVESECPGHLSYCMVRMVGPKAGQKAGFIPEEVRHPRGAGSVCCTTFHLISRSKFNCMYQPIRSCQESDLCTDWSIKHAWLHLHNRDGYHAWVAFRLMRYWTLTRCIKHFLRLADVVPPLVSSAAFTRCTVYCKA